MAAPVVGSGTTTYAATDTATTVVLTKPVGLANGDTLIAFVANSEQTADNQWSAPDGTWTEHFDFFGDHDAVGLAVFSKPIPNAAGEGASYTFTGTMDPSGRRVGALLRITGADTTTPVVAKSAEGNSGVAGTDSANVVAPTVTPGVVDCLLLGGFVLNNTGSWTADGAMTEVADVPSGGSGGAGTKVMLEVAQQTLSASTATGTRTAVGSVSQEWCAILIAVQPPASAATTATATVAAATASGVGASDSIKASAGQATVAAAGLGATVQTGAIAVAGQATVAAAGIGAAGVVVATAGRAQVTATGLAASDAIVATTGQAQVTAAALGATVTTATSTTATAGVAAVVAAGLGAATAITATSGQAQVVAAALGATVSTASAATATATVAAASASAGAASVAVAATASRAASVAAAHQLAALLQASAGQAQATATANAATVAVSGSLTVQADTATATATAHGATVATSGVVTGMRRNGPLVMRVPDDDEETIAVLAIVLKDVQPFG